jgi:hypothetical protein
MQRAAATLSGPYLAEEATGLAVIASLRNLAQRLALLHRCAASPEECSRMLGPLRAFDGMHARLLDTHADEFAKQQRNIGLVLGNLALVQDAIVACRREVQDAVSKASLAFQSSTREASLAREREQEARSPEMPVSLGDLVEWAADIQRFVAADVLAKAAVAESLARLTPAAAAAAEVHAESGDALVDAIAAAADMWPLARPALPHAGAADTAGEFARVSEIMWKLTGAALGQRTGRDDGRSPPAAAVVAEG